MTVGPPVPYEVRVAVDDLYDRYSSSIDDGDLEVWPTLFVEDGRYRVVARENLERGLPLATMSCDSRAAMEDRVYALREANLYLPRTVRHLVGRPSIEPAGSDEWRARASVAVFETVSRRPTTVLSVGEYRDHLVTTPDGLRFAERVCVYDSELVPNSLVFPL